MMLVGSVLSCAQDVDLTASVRLEDPGKKPRSVEARDVVVWLTSVGGSSATSLPATRVAPRPRLLQKNKSFEPHVLVVPVGASVEFPNKDPFFHNVFSLFEGKRFDLGLYEAGTTRDVVFDKPGISYIFCNIHAEMSAVVIALSTPYYGVSNKRGQVAIAHVPAGRYILRLWYEGALPETLNGMTREIRVSEDTSSLGLFRLPASGLPQTHKNMYGRDYAPPTPGNPAYERP
jgi:plastocyanin